MFGATRDPHLDRRVQHCPVLGDQRRRHRQLLFAQVLVGAEGRVASLGKRQFEAPQRDIWHASKRHARNILRIDECAASQVQPDSIALEEPSERPPQTENPLYS